MFITDREPLSLDCMALSARACGLEAHVVHQEDGYMTDAADAGSTASTSGAEAHGQYGVVKCALLDWSRPVPEALGRCGLS